MKVWVVLTIVFLFSSGNLFGQRGKVTNAYNYWQSGDVLKAWETILPTMDEENPASVKTISHYRTYEVYGNILMEIGKSKNKKIRSLLADPYVHSFHSFKKAIELNEKDRSLKSIYTSLLFLEHYLHSTGSLAFEQKKYSTAVKHFEATLELKELEIYNKGKEVVDTAIIFNTALCAEFSDDFDKAMYYYRRAESYDYKPIQCYAHYVNCMNQKGDKEGAFRAMTKGIEKYPNSKVITLLLFDHHITNKEYKQAVQHVDNLIGWEPNNAKYYIVKGDVLNKMGDYKGSIVEFLNAIKVDPMNENAYYSAGVHFYNSAVRQTEYIRHIPVSDNTKYKEEFAKIMPLIEKSIPFLEKAVELNSSNFDCLKILKTAYFRVNRVEKVSEIEALLGEM